jgi:peptidoglycan/xylan/chitin deacetylase (PgdA/CDA1 family)
MLTMARKWTGMLALLLCLCLMLQAAAEDEDPLSQFVIHHGDRNVNKIAITVDDCYKTAREWIARDVELCLEYGIQMTFFPVVHTGCLEEKYRDLWQSVVDSGCEIGTHTYAHMKLGNRDAWDIVRVLGQAQEALDKTLGYHYQVRWLRPPYGSVASGKVSTEKRVIAMIKKYGFDHIIHWDVSETKDLKKALKNIQNGSILLFHAKEKDTKFLEKLIPELKERGFEMVTVSELLGFGPPETGDELYVYNKADYQNQES